MTILVVQNIKAVCQVIADRRRGLQQTRLADTAGLLGILLKPKENLGEIS